MKIQVRFKSGLKMERSFDLQYSEKSVNRVNELFNKIEYLINEEWYTSNHQMSLEYEKEQE